MEDFYIMFNGKTNLDLLIDIVNRPVIPTPVERVNIETRTNKEDVYKHTGIYEDMTIEVEFNFDTYDFNEISVKDILRNVKAWLLTYQDNKLVFSDDLDWYFKVKNIIMSETALQEIEDFGNLTVQFIVSPYQYAMSGLEEISITNNSIINNYFKSCPKYIIKGDGIATLNINNKILKVNVSGNCTVDTELGLCIRYDGTYHNVENNILDFTDFYLQVGINTIYISNGFELTVVPNWRCL